MKTTLNVDDTVMAQLKREAARQGLLTIQERRREGRRNDFNIVRIISAEWLGWIARQRGRTGCKTMRPTDSRFGLSGKSVRRERQSTTPTPTSEARQQWRRGMG